MANWKIDRTEAALTVTYYNLQSGVEFNCGENRLDTPVGLILDWIADQAEPGDVIYAFGRPVGQKFKEARDDFQRFDFRQIVGCA